jgi:HPt (histidine-containing phosphotransfer) domain-containing protein
MDYGTGQLVNWSAFSQARAELGSEFVRILGYFREDGVKSLAAIEDAMRTKNSAGLVRPAHTLKGESLQFGAEPLGLLAETIEHRARSLVEMHSAPDELVAEVARLRPLFEETLAMFDREVGLPAATSAPQPAPTSQPAPAPQPVPPAPGAVLRRPQGFGRKVA